MNIKRPKPHRARYSVKMTVNSVPKHHVLRLETRDMILPKLERVYPGKEIQILTVVEMK